MQDAPKAYNFDEVDAWIIATNELLGHIGTNQIPCGVHPYWDEAKNRQAFLSAIAHLRGLLVNMNEDYITV